MNKQNQTDAVIIFSPDKGEREQLEAAVARYGYEVVSSTDNPQELARKVAGNPCATVIAPWDHGADGLTATEQLSMLNEAMGARGMNLVFISNDYVDADARREFSHPAAYVMRDDLGRGGVLEAAMQAAAVDRATAQRTEDMQRVIEDIQLG